MVDDLITRGPVDCYEMGDSDGLRAAIERVLANPAAAQARAEKALAWARSHHSAPAYHERIMQAVESAFGDGRCTE